MVPVGTKVSLRHFSDLSWVWLGFFLCLGFFVFGVNREHLLAGYGAKRSQCTSVTLIQEIPFIHISDLVS